ncbi:hypothetical protein [Mangrovibacillus cuniculi]|uniref:Abortive phage infection protein n=1 Tax=Mangrovibacillus cuniculi TaxID=2593652 RepID=A0A7S8CA10_9BACI|nr:hypothetical protein [Mangrovibacillus cuniculi]QPC46154.1 hypothetical protein G8O30_03860 [Mangrovibacillus cuniculi]
MNIEEMNKLFDQLVNGERDSLQVTKEDFLLFRKVLVNRADFKHFRGVAERGGSVTYFYEKEERS